MQILIIVILLIANIALTVYNASAGHPVWIANFIASCFVGFVFGAILAER